MHACFSYCAGHYASLLTTKRHFYGTNEPVLMSLCCQLMHTYRSDKTLKDMKERGKGKLLRIFIFGLPQK